MPNRRRGEVALQLGDTRYTLCLTLGALAELEDAFGVAGSHGARRTLRHGAPVETRDLLTLLAVALRGGGHAMSDAEVANLPLHEGIEPVAAALADLLVTTFGGGDAAPNPPSAAGGEREPHAFPWDDALTLGLEHPAVEPGNLLARDAARIAGGLGGIVRRANDRACVERRSQAVDGGFSGLVKAAPGCFLSRLESITDGRPRLSA